MRPVVKIPSGRYFNLVDFSKNIVTIDDVAFSLANINRFTGHRGTYSVAQHSVLVSYAVPEQYALDGLLHELEEFVLNDISSPVKSLLPDYRALSNRIGEYLAGVFGTAWPHPPEIKIADNCVLAAEVRDLGRPGMLGNEEHDRDDTWDMIRGLRPYPEYRIRPWAPILAYENFVDRYNEIIKAKSNSRT